MNRYWLRSGSSSKAINNIRKRKQEPPNKKKEKSPTPNFDEICPICQSTMTKPCHLDTCTHKACLKCFRKWVNIRRNCPVCRSIPNTSFTVYDTPGKTRQVRLPRSHVAFDIDMDITPIDAVIAEAERDWLRNRILQLEEENRLIRQSNISQNQQR